MIKRLISILQESSNSFEGQGVEERVILLLRQHYFTILTRVGLLSLACLIPILVGIKFWPYFASHNWSDIFLLISSVLYLGIWLTIFYSLTMYTLNTVIITDHRIIENSQEGFFNRKTAELHSHRIQDVSVRTHGIIETFLKFGNITVQTAASEKQFVFHQIPKPEIVKDIIMKITAANHSGIKSPVHNSDT